MRVAFVGSRIWTDWKSIEKAMKALNSNTDTIISGGARGVDTMSIHVAKKLGFRTLVHEADWERNGFAAGYIRNEEIVSDSDIVHAFWDGESKGTLHTITIAENARKEVIVHKLRLDDPKS